MKKIFGPKRDEATGEWRKLYNEVLNDLHSSTNIIRVIKSGMGWAGHVARMRDSIGATGFWWANRREKDHLEDPGVDGRLIFRWILRKCNVGMDWIDLVQDRDR